MYNVLTISNTQVCKFANDDGTYRSLIITGLAGVKLKLMVRDLNFKDVKVCGEGVFATYYNLSDRSDGGVHVTSRNATTLQRNACSIS